MKIEAGLELDNNQIIHNPGDDFFKEFLKPYYVITADWQYLFASKQPGRRPDRVFYMVPSWYKLGKGQKKFDTKTGKKIYKIVLDYLKTAKVIVQERIQGEKGYETGLRIVTSIENPHSAYMPWMGKMMTFPPKKGVKIHCWNYIIPEPLPKEYIKRIKQAWPEYDETQPLTLFDLTKMKEDKRRVINLGVDYFGGAFKKPNLTMVWNRGEAHGLISYHAGCTNSRVLKGLSGTGKTTLTVGPDLAQDDALLGKPIYRNGKIIKSQLIGLEAASYAKSQGLNPKSPEWPGLMKSRQVDKNGEHPIVLAQNIDCEGVRYVYKKINGYEVKVPEKIPGKKIGHFQCTEYESSGTTNGRFVFLFSEVNKNWKPGLKKFLKTESLSFKRFDILEPAFRVTDPVMAVALDSACESIITSAVAKKKPGTRVRSYAATDFMAREESQQAVLKWEMYRDLDLSLKGKLVFFINNAGYVGEYDLEGKQIKKIGKDGKPIPKIDRVTGNVQKNELGKIVYLGQGEKIRVEDSKKLVHLIESRKIKNWIEHPVFHYLIPDPKELEKVHGMKNFGKRFNPLRYYTAKEYVKFIKRDIKERTEFLKNLFKGQTYEKRLKPVIHVWEKCKIPSESEIEEFYRKNYG